MTRQLIACISNAANNSLLPQAKRRERLKFCAAMLPDSWKEEFNGLLERLLWLI